LELAPVIFSGPLGKEWNEKRSTATKKVILLATTMVLSVFFGNLSFGQDLIIFPAKGQTPEQM